MKNEKEIEQAIKNNQAGLVEYEDDEEYARIRATITALKWVLS